MGDGGWFYANPALAKVSRLRDYPFDTRWYAALWEPWPTFIDENPHQELMAVRTAHPVLGGVQECLRSLPQVQAPRSFVRRLLGPGRTAGPRAGCSLGSVPEGEPG